MKLALTFCVKTSHYPSTFDEIDMVQAIADILDIDAETIEYDMDEVD